MCRQAQGRLGSGHGSVKQAAQQVPVIGRGECSHWANFTRSQPATVALWLGAKN